MNGAILDKTKVLEKYYNYLDESEEYSNESKELYLKFLLSLNYTLYDVYVLLKNLYFNENKYNEGLSIIEQGYNVLMKKEFNNKLPKTLEYLKISNRDIFRLLYNYADILWIKGDTHGAIKLFRKLINLCPNDNIGARYALCGILGEVYCSSNHLWNEQNQNIDKWFKNEVKKNSNKKEYKILVKYLK